MQTPTHRLFKQFGSILGICPCCGELFRLAEARPYLREKPPHSLLDKLESEERRIEQDSELLDEQEERLRERASELGARQTKNRLRKIDRAFSGAGLDPQDVRVIFDPVEYVVFDGMNGKGLRKIMLVAHLPKNRLDEGRLHSIERTIRAGNISFKTLRILPDFSLVLN